MYEISKPQDALFVRYGMHQISFFHSKEHNSRKGDNLAKKKLASNYLFLHEESINEISKPLQAQFLMHGQTDGCTTQNLYALSTSSMLGT